MATPVPGSVESLCRAHEAVRNDLRQLEKAIGPHAAEPLSGLIPRLEATYTHLSEHFSCEEQNGYFESVREREPRLERTIERLAEEHLSLRQSLEALLREARTSPVLGEGFRDRVRAWICSVRQHEARENELIENAFNVDISAED